MKKTLLMEKFPIFVKEILKTETLIKNTDEFISKIKTKVEEDDTASFISIFDHFSHTKNLNWPIQEWIIDAKIILFCFWQEIPKAEILAVRPRNIWVVEYEDKFVISFLEAPKEWANNKKIEWILENLK